VDNFHQECEQKDDDAAVTQLNNIARFCLLFKMSSLKKINYWLGEDPSKERLFVACN
jgi:hypothetical protein